MLKLNFSNKTGFSALQTSQTSHIKEEIQSQLDFYLKTNDLTCFPLVNLTASLSILRRMESEIDFESFLGTNVYFT